MMIFSKLSQSASAEKTNLKLINFAQLRELFFDNFELFEKLISYNHLMEGINLFKGEKDLSSPDFFILKSLYLYQLSLRELGSLYGFQVKLRFNRNTLFWYFLSLYGEVGEVEFIKELKYELAYPIAMFLRNAEPEKSTFPSIFSLRREFRKIVRAYTSETKKASYFFSINNMKRVFPNLPSSYKEAMEIKHKKTVESEPIRIPRWVKKKTQRIIEEIFPKNWDRAHQYELSHKGSSCLQKSRSKGGHHAYWAEELTRAFELDRVPQIIVTSPEFESTIENIDTFISEKVDNFELQDTYEAKAECVEDPLKIRIITKNNANFSILKGLQRAMWKRLQKFPAFIFTGTPAAGEYLEYFFKTLAPSKSTHLFVSGDYASATDNFVPEMTELILETVLGNSELKARYQQCAIDSVTHHIIRYNFIEPAVQKNGQMMGSLLSFPVLCLYNYALWHIAMERYLKTKVSVSWGLKRVLINGDDILFLANKALYDIWWKTVTEFGLEPSLGKNLADSKFFTINSQLFKWDHVNQTGSSIGFVKIQFLFRTNHIYFDKKSGNGLTYTNLPEILSALDRDVESWNILPFDEKKFKRNIIYYNKKEYSKHDFRSLFLPRNEGGHGIVPIDEKSGSRLSVEQKIYREKYINGYCVKDFMQKSEDFEGSWKRPRRPDSFSKFVQKHCLFACSMEESLWLEEVERVDSLNMEIRKTKNLITEVNHISPRKQIGKFLKKSKINLKK